MTDKEHARNAARRFLARIRRIRAASWVIAALFLLLGGSLAGAAWYGYERVESLSAQIAVLNANLASTTSALQDTIASTNANLTSAIDAQGENVATVKAQLGGVQSQVGSIGGTVDTLQKLSKLDPQLLEKYSKVYFLSENYAPASLVDIPNDYKYYNDRPMQVIPQVLPYLEKMISQAKSDGVMLYIYSAYRSFSTQETLKNEYTVIYGAGTANQFSADQGYSEHQLGTAADFITTGQNGRLTQNFDQTSAYQWLVNNAYTYGFVLSYPKGNSYYIYEPWHWRFVGVKLATDLHTAGKYFYDLDQRTIDTYLISLFD